MAKIIEYDLISGKPFAYEDYTIFPPLLDTISDIKICGYQKYLTYLYPFCVSKEDLMEEMGMLEWYQEKLNDKEKQELTVFKILFLSHSQLLKEAIQFFIEERVSIDEKEGCFVLYENKKRSKKIIAKINNDNFASLCDAVCQVNYRQRPDNSTNVEELTFRSEQAKQKYMRFLKLRKEFHKNKQKQNNDNEDFELGNVIASLGAKGVGYTLINIGRLTVYQLYDQFYKTIKNHQVDAYAQKWAAWGTKDFDFSSWYHKDKKSN